MRMTPGHLFSFPPAAYLFQRHPSPAGYPNTYQLYAMENTRQTILSDYITSQQMSPREQQLAVPYPPGSQGARSLLSFHNFAKFIGQTGHAISTPWRK